MNAVQFAFDYIYHYETYKERHPHHEKYRFGRMKPRGTAPITKLYRGLYFETKEGYDQFLQSIKQGTLTTKEPSSWTIDKGVADFFAVSPYVVNKCVGYGAIIMKAVNIPIEQVLFDSLLAHGEFIRCNRKIPNPKPYSDEWEIVLKPSILQVEVVQTVNFAELEKLMQDEKNKRQKE